MSEQLKRNGHAVGSQAYFTELDWENDAIRNTGRVMDHCYSDMLEHLAERAEQTLDTIWWDYSKYANVMRYFPVRERERMMELVKGLGDLAECGGKSTSRVSHILSLLKLSSLVTGGKSHASVSEIERWCEPVIRGKYLSTSRQTELLKKASESNTVSLSDKREAEFLNAVCLGKSREVLTDMLLCAKYRIEHTRYTGECGYELGSERYVAWAEGRIFKKRPENLHGYAFAACFEEALERVVQTIREDLKNGEWRGDFLKDEEAELLRQAVRHLEKCGIACYDINNIIDKLDWYVEADENRVLKLQKALNALPFGSTLKEDGILGEKTVSAWETFSREFQKANCPKLQWKAAPLRDGIDVSALMNVSQTMAGYGVLEKTLKNMEDLAKKLQHGTNHKELQMLEEFFPSLRSTEHLSEYMFISHKAKRFLDNMGDSVRVVKQAGKTFAVAGVVADVLLAGAEVYEDVKDDGKIGKRSTAAVLSTGASVAVGSMIGSWGGGMALGAKLGAVFGLKGVVIGAVVVPIILTIIGEEAAGAMVGWMVEVTELSEERGVPTAAQLFRLE